MNNTKIDKEKDEESIEYFIAALAIVLCVLNILFHVLLIIVIKSSKLLYTCTNAFVLSIATSETIHGTFRMVVVVYPTFADCWLPDRPFCYVILFFIFFGKSSANFSLMMLSMDRCIAIYKPVRYSSLITPFSTGLIIALIWISSTVVASILFWDDKHDFPKSIHSLSKHLNPIRHRLLTITVLSTFVPMVVMIVAISVIIREARSRHRIFALATLPFVFPAIKTKAPLNTLRAMRSLFLIVTSYIIFCVSGTILCVVQMYHVGEYTKVIVDFNSIWSMICCVLTPIIIAFCNRSYSKRLRHILCKCFRLKNSIKPADFSVSTGLHSILEASYMISNFRPIPNNLILLASQSSRVHLRNSSHANPTAQSRILFEKPMLKKALSSPG